MRGIVAFSLGVVAGGCLQTDGGWEDGPRRPELPIHEEVVYSDPAPPPISGGTLHVSADGESVWASDPDRDLVWHVGLDPAVLWSATELGPGDEPGRIAEDAAFRVHVVLRGAGEIATIEPGFAQEPVRRAVCAEPRGIAYDRRADAIHVACTSGDFVTFPAAGGPETRRVRLDADDLRDVVMFGDAILVSRFRSAEILVLSVGESGEISEAQPRIVPEVESFIGAASAAVAWRLVGTPDGGAAMTLQAQSDTELGTGAGVYYGSIAEPNVLLISPDGDAWAFAVGFAPLPVDVAVSPLDGGAYVASAATVSEAQFGGYYFGGYASAQLAAVAIAFTADGVLVQQTREPYSIKVGDDVVDLPGPSRTDSGHETFHQAVAGNGLACASCHPEGREDGHTWQFDVLGARRTQSLAGGILGTAPFHWSGDLSTFEDLMDEVFVNRMLAPRPSEERVGAVASWLDQVAAPRPEASRDPAAAERGRALFETAACSGCHRGERLTNDASVDVGTGGEFQVPALAGVFARAPFMHDGCAETLADRFDPGCGGAAHGAVEELSEGEIGDLVAYLETL